MFFLSLQAKTFGILCKYFPFHGFYGFKSANCPYPSPLGNSCFSPLRSGYIKSNKYIIKVYTISFHLIPNTLCLTGGATKIDF